MEGGADDDGSPSTTMDPARRAGKPRSRMGARKTAFRENARYYRRWGGKARKLWTCGSWLSLP